MDDAADSHGIYAAAGGKAGLTLMVAVLVLSTSLGIIKSLFPTTLITCTNHLWSKERERQREADSAKQFHIAPPHNERNNCRR